MIADYDKANRLREESWRYNAPTRIAEGRRRWHLARVDRFLAHKMGRASLLPARLQARLAAPFPRKAAAPFPYKDKAEDPLPRPGRWFHAGTDRTVHLLERIGYAVVQKDIGLLWRDPIVHFRKP
jgi:hypothetical protein